MFVVSYLSESGISDKVFESQVAAEIFAIVVDGTVQCDISLA